MTAQITRALAQANLQAGDRMLVVDRTSVSVFPSDSGVRSNAAWVASTDRSPSTVDYYARKPWIVLTDAFPSELTALISGVLDEGCPVQPLMDWVIDNGPACLAAEIEALQTNLLTEAMP